MKMRVVAISLAALAACSGSQGRGSSAAPSNALAPLASSDESAPRISTPASTVTLAGGEIVLSEPIEFVTGQSELRATSDGILLTLAEFLVQHPAITMLRIEGHSDNAGTGAYNQALTEGRALAVARWLVDHGIACSRLIAVGFGETKPIDDNATVEGRAHNRRMTLVPAALNDHPIGGLPVDGGGAVAGDPCP